MDSATLSAVAALAGSVIGGLTSFFSSWLSLNTQLRVQLLVQDGVVVDWPYAYFSRVAAIEGREIPRGPRRPATDFGPPA